MREGWRAERGALFGRNVLLDFREPSRALLFLECKQGPMETHSINLQRVLVTKGQKGELGAYNKAKVLKSRGRAGGSAVGHLARGHWTSVRPKFRRERKT